MSEQGLSERPVASRGGVVLRVSGGGDLTRICTDELRERGTGLRAATARVGELTRVARAIAHPGPLSFTYAPATARRFDDTLDLLLLELAAIGGALQRLIGALDAASCSYDDAEATAVDRVSQGRVGWAGGLVSSVFKLGWGLASHHPLAMAGRWVAGQGTERDWDPFPDYRSLFEGANGLVWGLAPHPLMHLIRPDLARGWTARQIAATLGVPLALLSPGGRVGVTKVERLSDRPVAAPRSFEEAADAVRYVQDAEPAAISITTLDLPDGSRRHLVAMPGVQGLNLGGSDNPLGARSAVQALVGRPNEYSQGVVDAMSAHGISPGDTTVLIGHSLGGMVATNLATSPQAVRRYGIAGVVTMGSPTDAIAGERRVPVLRFETDQDITPRLDGGTPAGAPGDITVRVDLDRWPDDRLAEIDSVLDGAHDVETYVALAKQADSVADPALGEVREALAPVLQNEVVVGERSVYRFVELADAEPAREMDTARPGRGDDVESEAPPTGARPPDARTTEGGEGTAVSTPDPVPEVARTYHPWRPR